MARIAGVDIPKQKRGVIALTYIFGIGRSRAKEILTNAKVDESIKVADWDDDQIGRIREAVGKMFGLPYLLSKIYFMETYMDMPPIKKITFQSMVN